jgi:hypothetical protein
MELGSPGKTVPADNDNVEPRSPENMGHVHAHTLEAGSSKDAYKGSGVDYVPNENGTFHILLALGIGNKLHSNGNTHSVSQFLSCLMCAPQRKYIICHRMLT